MRGPKVRGSQFWVEMIAKISEKWRNSPNKDRRSYHSWFHILSYIKGFSYNLFKVKCSLFVATLGKKNFLWILNCFVVCMHRMYTYNICICCINADVYITRHFWSSKGNLWGQSSPSTSLGQDPIVSPPHKPDLLAQDLGISPVSAFCIAVGVLDLQRWGNHSKFCPGLGNLKSGFILR